MHRTLISLLRTVDIRFFYAFMRYGVIPVTMVVSPGARLTYRYFREKKSEGRWASLKHTFQNHCLFGQTVIDKFAMYGGRTFLITYHGLDYYQQLAQRPEPLLILGAHIGCSEIVGYSLHQHKPCNVLVYGGEKEELMKYRQSSFGNMAIRMIPVGVGTDHSDEIVQALDRGEAVSAFADRFMTQNKVVVGTLHGHHVQLAKGPFSLAVTRGIEVIMVSGLKESDGSYTAYITPLHYDKTADKRTQRQQLADAYCAEIARLLEQYPLQWFNYSDIWTD